MLSYLDRGSGSAVLLLHAFPLDNTMWNPQLDLLSRKFRVIAPDMHGFGKSQPPLPWTMEQMADDLDELLNAAGIASASVIGVSIGGYIALSLWSNHPNRVSRLVLSNSRARADNDTEKASRNDMIALLQQSGISALPDRMLPRLLQPNPNPDTVRYVRNTIERANAAAAAYALMSMRDRMDFSSMVHRINFPVLVVSGEYDAIIRSEDSRAVADSIPGAQFVNIPNSGHLSNLENPAAYNAVLVNFLDSK
jgi:3-oxoadipate enol-lactonase